MPNQKNNIDLGNFEEKNLLKTFNWIKNKGFKQNFLFEKDISWNNHIIWYKNYTKDITQKIYTINVDGVYIGNIGLKNIDSLKNSAESWIYIGDEIFKGKGYAKSAYKLFKLRSIKLGIIKLTANIGSFNKDSIYFHEKLGFKKTSSNGNILFDKKIEILVYEINLT